MISNRDKDEIKKLFIKLFEILYQRQPKPYEYTIFLTACDEMIERVLMDSKQKIINILYEYLSNAHPNI